MNRHTSDILTDLVQAAGRTGTTRRDLVKLAGAAALAAGLAGPMATQHRAAAAQADKNVLIYASGQDISNLDPHTGSDYSITWAQRATYDSILRFEGNPPVVKPLVAKEVTGSEDAKTWTLKLDPAATFPDGSAVDGDVIKWNFERLLKKNLGVSWMFADVMTADSVKVVDPATVEITLTKSFAPFDLILPWLFLANPAVVKEHVDGDDDGEKWLQSNAAGSGPYTISQWQPGTTYQFDRRADYWFTTPGITKPIDTFVWRINRESSSRRLGMEAGEIQYSDYFSVEDIEGLAAESQFRIYDVPSYLPFAVKLNNASGPTADLNVRKALAAALDYDSVLAVANGRGTLMEGPLPPQYTPWHTANLPLIRFNMDEAKSYLAASEQYKDGFEIEYVYVTGTANEEQIGLILLDALSQLNITVTITPMVWPDLVARVADPASAPSMVAIYNSVNYMDPDNFFWQSYHSSQAGSWANASQFKSEEIDKLLEDGRSTVDPDARKKIYDEVQTKLVEQAVEIWLYCEIPNIAWVTQLGDGPVSDNFDIRLLEYSAS
ncbi:MAG: ABC transporter substrate-binding protein [Thermomicrobiales bacterium]